MSDLVIPSSFQFGYDKAHILDPDLTDIYVAHTLVGDPAADAAVASMAHMHQSEAQRLINAGMESQEDVFRDAPDALRELFAVVESPPPAFVYNPKKASAGMRAFHKYSDLFFVGMVLDATLTGLTASMSKSFYATGRLTETLRRVKQNTRHFVEITLPGGLERYGDGWKVTLRIRLIHAQIRRLFLESDDWDVASDGLPVSAAHLALSSTSFSAATLASVRKMGVRMTAEERAGFMHIWHCVKWLIGVPEALIFESEEDTMHLRRIGRMCEDITSHEAVELSHAQIAIVPKLLGITDAKQQQKLTRFLYRTARALMGDELADAREYPKQSTVGVLALARAQRRAQIIRARLMPSSPSHTANNFIAMMQRTAYDDAGISYRMPDAVKNKDSLYY